MRGRGVFRILHLFAYGSEKLANSDPACRIGDESGNLPAIIRVDRISRARFVIADWLEQPTAFANPDSRKTLRFCRPGFIGRFKPVEKYKTVLSAPRFFAHTQSVIAIAHDLWRKSLVEKSRTALLLYDPAFHRVRHKARIIPEIIDHRMHRADWRIDFADGLEFLQRRVRTRATVKSNLATPVVQFPSVTRERCSCRITGQTRCGQDDNDQENFWNAFPWHLAILANFARRRSHKNSMEPMTGFEPVTYGLRSCKKRQSQLLANCVDEYLEARQRDLERGELGKRSLAEIVGRAKQLKSVLGSLHVGEIGHDRIKTFIESHPVAARTRTNVRLRASKFFNWCRDKGYIDHNPCERIRFKVPESDIHIMTVDAVRTLLSAAQGLGSRGHSGLRAVLGLFAGIRVAEIHALRWEHVDLETRTVEVAAESSKVRKQRFVEINDTLLAWLKPIYRKRGKITGPNFRRRWAATLKAAGYSKQNRLPQNILRHTAASMMIAVSHRGVVSEQLGNSPQVLAAHYRRPVPKRVAAVYWSLRP